MPQTNSDDLCLRFLNLSGEIRFAGVIDRMGGLIAGGMKEGIESLENDEESIKLYLGYAFNNAVRQDFDPTFGKVLYTLSERESLNWRLSLLAKIFFWFPCPNKPLTSKLSTIFCIFCENPQ